MQIIHVRSIVRGAVAATALCLASHAAWAGFVLTTSSSTVARGGSFQATLSYVGADALYYALDVTPLSATRPGFTLTGLTPLVTELDSIFVGPTDVPLSLPVFISAFLNDPVGGSNVQVDLWQFDIEVDPGMALGAITLAAAGGSADIDFNEILYDVSVDLQVVDGGGGQLPEGGTLPSVAIALAALALVRKAVPHPRPATGRSALRMQASGLPSA